MPTLSRTQILQCDDVQRERVEVPEWGGYVYVRSMTGQERERLEMALVDDLGNPIPGAREQLRARLVALTVVDDDNQRLFKTDDVPQLQQKNSAVLDRLFTKAQHLSGITQDDVEALTKNSETAPSGGSGSD